MSTHLAHRAPARNKTIDLPGLFSCRSTTLDNSGSRAGHHVMRRCRVSPDAAEVIAELAGLGGHREAR
jgi:hypothetical protein